MYSTAQKLSRRVGVGNDRRYGGERWLAAGVRHDRSASWPVSSAIPIRGLRPIVPANSEKSMHGINARLVGVATAMLASSVSLPLRASAQMSPVPTPESVFGFPVGAERKLFTYDESIGYFRRLAAASPNVRLIEVGRTSFGRPWTAVIISSPENLAKLDEYRRINQRLAHPEGLTDAEARTLARQGKAFVDISGGLHASEIAGSQHTPQLAYELLANAADPVNRAILDNTVLFLWPSINPDGQDIVVENCRARDAGPGAPPMELYQKYIGHDNNRDSYMLNVV
jgi:hypothetical protein